MPDRPAARRIISPSLLALALAIGTVAGAVGRDGITPSGVPADPPGHARALPTGEVLGARTPVRIVHPWAISPAGTDHPLDGGSSPTDDRSARVGQAERRPVPKVPVVRAAVERRGPGTGASAGRGDLTSRSSPAVYRGRSHVWMPSLGLDRSVAGYACSNKSYPGDRVYRWGCAGANNVYLFGHAHSVFTALHDAYVRGTLKKGQELFYADPNGTVRRYTVSWWKVTTPTKGTWAYAAQATPSLTLQTCVGSRSQYRLIVRLARDG